MQLSLLSALWALSNITVPVSILSVIDYWCTSSASRRPGHEIDGAALDGSVPPMKAGLPNETCAMSASLPVYQWAPGSNTTVRDGGWDQVVAKGTVDWSWTVLGSTS